MLILGVTSCGSTINSYCAIAKPHVFSDAAVDAMSDEEVKQELTHNEQYAKVCL
jgi:ABC-type uncharacterized transport system substrate-binding protein